MEGGCWCSGSGYAEEEVARPRGEFVVVMLVRIMGGGLMGGWAIGGTEGCCVGWI